MFDVVYPVKQKEINENLRYSLRSLEKYAKNINKVWLIGYAPDWVTNVNVLRTEQKHDKWLNTRDNIEAACKCDSISEDFILFNDDFILTEEVSDWSYFTNCCRGTLFEQECKYLKLSESTPWRDGFHFNRQLLILAGCCKDDKEPLNYELHRPIIFNRERRLKLFERPEFKKYRYTSEQLLFQRSLYKNLFPDDESPRVIEDSKLFSDVREESFLTANGCFSVTEHLIGDSDNAPKLNKWLQLHLNKKSIFEK